MKCEMVVHGQLYFDNIRQATRLVRDIVGCERVKSYNIGDTLVNVCKDGRRVYMRFRKVTVAKRFETYVILDWVIVCKDGRGEPG